METAKGLRDPSELKPTLQTYEDFIHNKLEPDLTQVIEARDAIYTQMSEYLKLKTHIDTIRSQNLEELETKVDLGSNFYAKAFVSDTSRIFVSVGFGFHLEMTLDEADRFIDQKVEHMEKTAEKYTENANNIRAKIKLVYGALIKAMNLADK